MWCSRSWWSVCVASPKVSPLFISHPYKIDEDEHTVRHDKITRQQPVVFAMRDGCSLKIVISLHTQLAALMTSIRPLNIHTHYQVQDQGILIQSRLKMEEKTSKVLTYMGIPVFMKSNTTMILVHGGGLVAEIQVWIMMG